MPSGASTTKSQAWRHRKGDFCRLPLDGGGRSRSDRVGMMCGQPETGAPHPNPPPHCATHASQRPKRREGIGPGPKTTYVALRNRRHASPPTSSVFQLDHIPQTLLGKPAAPPVRWQCRARSATFPAVLGCLTLWLMIVAPASAHGFKIFVMVRGHDLTGYAYFPPDTPAAKAKIEVFSIEGERLSSTEADEAGRFAIPLTERRPIRIIAHADDLHVAAREIGLDEMPSTLPQAGEPATAISSELTTQQVDLRVEQVVADQIQPVREQLRRLEDQIRFRDIVGGIGYIVGVVGLIAYWKAQSRHQSSGTATGQN
jgi:nickel transport protein